jgi:glucan phosphoethanolaminetransferase (alkaline phosphatase superfamily)
MGLMRRWQTRAEKFRDTYTLRQIYFFVSLSKLFVIIFFLNWSKFSRKWFVNYRNKFQDFRNIFVSAKIGKGFFVPTLIAPSRRLPHNLFIFKVYIQNWLQNSLKKIMNKNYNDHDDLPNKIDSPHLLVLGHVVLQVETTCSGPELCDQTCTRRKIKKHKE